MTAKKNGKCACGAAVQPGQDIYYYNGRVRLCPACSPDGEPVLEGRIGSEDRAVFGPRRNGLYGYIRGNVGYANDERPGHPQVRTFDDYPPAAMWVYSVGKPILSGRA